MATPTVAVFADLTDQTIPPLEFAEAAQDRGFSGVPTNCSACATSGKQQGGTTPVRV
jgi:hypothetical protein